jgi:hypothetical protein
MGRTTRKVNSMNDDLFRIQLRLKRLEEAVEELRQLITREVAKNEPYGPCPHSTRLGPPNIDTIDSSAFQLLWATPSEDLGSLMEQAKKAGLLLPPRKRVDVVNTVDLHEVEDPYLRTMAKRIASEGGAYHGQLGEASWLRVSRQEEVEEGWIVDISTQKDEEIKTLLVFVPNEVGLVPDSREE